MDGRTNRQTFAQVDKQTVSYMDRRTDSWKDDKQTYEFKEIQTEGRLMDI